MSSDLPKVSIVLPVYNGSKYMRESIDSCLKQTHANIELIIVDDGSTDASAEIISSCGDARIRCVRHESNRGLPSALNTGFAHATGEYLTWTSHDNYYAAEAIECMLSVLRSKPCEFVYCDFYRFSEGSKSDLKLVKLPDSLVLGQHNDVGACFLYSAAVRKVIGDYDPDAELAEDYDYWIRVSKTFVMCHVNEPLYYYRQYPESLSLARFYEVRAAAVLVRIKNEVLSVDEAASSLIDVVAARHRPYYGLTRLLVKALFWGRIRRRLRAFQRGKSSFKDTRLAVRDIIQ